MENTSLNAIKKIAGEITKSIDLIETSEAIINEMAQTVGASGGALFLIDEEEKVVKAYRLINSILGRFAEKIIGEDVTTLSTPYDEPLNKVGFAVAHKKILKGDDLADFIYPTVSKKIAKMIQKTGRLKEIIVFPAMIHKKVVGCILLAFNKKINLDKEKMLILEIFTDQAAIAINNALKYKQLQDRYKLEKETTALLTHELKTPIAITHNSSQLLKLFIKQNEGQLSPEQIKKLEDLQEDMHIGIDRMNYLCNSIFSFREVENKVPQKHQKLNLKRSLAPMLETYKRKAEQKGIKFSCKITTRTKDRCGAGIQFEQILANLLDNAIKYTKKGSVEVKIKLNTKSLKASVTDTGVGITKKEQEKIFDRFQRSDNAPNQAEGLGLGLYITKKILEDLNGNISVSKNPKKKGTCFEVCIPVHVCE
jgi:signal transduction histidine kinase